MNPLEKNQMTLRDYMALNRKARRRAGKAMRVKIPSDLNFPRRNPQMTAPISVLEDLHKESSVQYNEEVKDNLRVGDDSKTA